MRTLLSLLTVIGFFPMFLFAQGSKENLLSSTRQWQANVDRGRTQIALSQTDGTIRADIATDGGPEDYPKIRLTFRKPRDWQPYARLRARVRLTTDEKNARRKHIAFVFYDEKTRLPNYYPGRPLEQQPMKQQVLSHWIAVGRWVNLTDWLMQIRRSAVRQLDIYLYEQPPAAPHKYRWEFARLELEQIGGNVTCFDGEVFARRELKGSVGEPVASVRTADGLELSVGPAGEIHHLLYRGITLGRASTTSPTGLLVRDAATDNPPAMVGGKLVQRNGEIRQSAKLAPLALSIDAVYASRGQYIEISGKVSDLRQQDRAVTVYFALPLSEGAWQWWDSVSTARTNAGESGELCYLERGMQYGLNGAHSKYPLGAVTRPNRAGLTLAVPMDEPVVHRIAYNPGLHLFYVALDFGLVHERRVDGRPLSEANFRVLLYSHNPEWGFRSALQRYYDFFPHFFTKRVKTEGGWYVWGNMSQTKGALEAGFRFHWGPRGTDAVRWDNAHGALALFYIESETYQQSMQDFTRAPSLDDAFARLRKLARGDPAELAKVAAQPYRVYPLAGTGEPVTERIRLTARCVLDSLSFDIGGQPYCHIGRFGWMGRKWGAIFACNLAPAIPNGKGWLNREKVIEPALRAMETSGAHYDGIALDSFGGYGQASRVNYRREHFRYSTFPLSFSAYDRRPVQVAFFETVAWLRELAREMRPRGKVLMANCSWGATPGWLSFAAPYLDIFGAEHPKFADPDFIRAIAYRKPCTDLPYKPRPEWEVAAHLLHAIFPGHGNDLTVLRRYAPLLRKLASAGWEPITAARAEPTSVRIERFGAAEPAYLVVSNLSQKAQRVRITLEAPIAPAERLTAVRLPEKQELHIEGDHFNLALKPQETTVISLFGQH